jgi:UPF0755 protein
MITLNSIENLDKRYQTKNTESKEKMKRIIALVIAFGLGIGLYQTLPLIQFASSPASSDQAEKKILIEIPKGALPRGVSENLAAQGLISDSSSFLNLGRVLRKWGKLKAGEYELSPSQSPLEIFETITSGISVMYPVTFQEGLNIYQIAEELEKKGFGPQEEFVKLAKDPKFLVELGFKPPLPLSIEGYLFPDTYHLLKRSSPQMILKKMVNRFNEVWTPEIEAKAKAMGFTKHQLIILASVVEKETGAPSDRRIVSSVFHNRLKTKMRLDSDPTIIYGIWEQYSGNIRREDKKSQTPFNTYVISGLPAGPISNPGIEAIKATLDPETTNYFYFVSKNDGTTYFSESLKEHSAAVYEYQINPKGREGRSWRNLGKQ